MSPAIRNLGGKFALRILGLSTVRGLALSGDRVMGEQASVYYIGVDTGGTFTDLVIIDDAGNVRFEKAFSTPDNPALGVMAAFDTAATSIGRPSFDILNNTERFSHGTTVGTNALIQRRGARVGLILTEGFQDTTLIGRGPMGRVFGAAIGDALDYIHHERPTPIVPRERIAGVAERVSVDGSTVLTLREDTVEAALAQFRREKVESIAVSLLWSFRNEVHERRIGNLLAQWAPDLLVSLSVDVAPVLGEFERSMTTIVNAYVGPVLSQYVLDLQRRLADSGLKPVVQLMKSSGGVTLPGSVTTQAVSLINSGPVGGLVAARYLGEKIGYSNIITSDMGGTSFDVGLVYEGKFELEKTPAVDVGIPVQIPALKVDTIGAGGGSIAWSDGRRLMVGPQSAGAFPGPACFENGGVDPTVTDALVVLGILDPKKFFGGRRVLSLSKAKEAIRNGVADRLGLSVMDAAAGIYEIVTAKMSDLIRKITVEAGYDPRDFALFAYGGAAPAHAALYAEALGVRELIIPHTSSVFSALGCALSDVLYTYARSQPMPLEEFAAVAAGFDNVYREMEYQAFADMEMSGYLPNQVRLSRRLDVRYEGQMNDLTIPWPSGKIDKEAIEAAREVFESAYETRYGKGTSRSESPLETMTFRVDALVETVKPPMIPHPEGSEDSSHARTGTREVYLYQTGFVQADVFDGYLLNPGNIVAGPALIERPDTTILVPPRHQSRVDGHRNIRMTIGEEL